MIPSFLKYYLKDVCCSILLQNQQETNFYACESMWASQFWTVRLNAKWIDENINVKNFQSFFCGIRHLDHQDHLDGSL